MAQLSDLMRSMVVLAYIHVSYDDRYPLPAGYRVSHRMADRRKQIEPGTMAPRWLAARCLACQRPAKTVHHQQRVLRLAALTSGELAVELKFAGRAVASIFPEMLLHG